MELASDPKMLIILDELKQTVYFDPITHGDPTPESDIRTWFKRVEEVDTATNAPSKRVDRFLSNLFHRLPDDNFGLGKEDLLAGKFDTPRDLLAYINPDYA